MDLSAAIRIGSPQSKLGLVRGTTGSIQKNIGRWLSFKERIKKR